MCPSGVSAIDGLLGLGEECPLDTNVPARVRPLAVAKLLTAHSSARASSAPQVVKNGIYRARRNDVLGENDLLPFRFGGVVRASVLLGVLLRFGVHALLIGVTRLGVRTVGLLLNLVLWLNFGRHQGEASGNHVRE